jgi:hypothetical protein
MTNATEQSAGDQLDVSEVGDEQPVGCGHRNCRSTGSGTRFAVGSGTVVRTFLCRLTPCQPFERIRRLTVDFATSMPPRAGRPTSSATRTPAPALRGPARRFVVADQDLGDRGVPQGPLRGCAGSPRVERARGDRHAVLGSAMNQQTSVVVSDASAGRSPARRRTPP